MDAIALTKRRECREERISGVKNNCCYIRYRDVIINHSRRGRTKTGKLENVHIYTFLSQFTVNEPKSSRSLQTSDCDRQTVARRSRVRAKESKGKCIGFDRFFFCFFSSADDASRRNGECREQRPEYNQFQIKSGGVS